MILVVSILLLLSLALATLAGGISFPDKPPTAPEQGGNSVMKSTTVASRCSGLSGAMEIQVLVGPAEVLGLLPFSMGEIRFSVDSGGGAYLVHGQGAITYQETLTEAWVTYSVSFDMKGTFEGECIGEPGSEELEIITEMSGEQIVEVRADGFQGDYPWSGTHTLYLTLPLEEGAVVEGEGCAFVLHLSE